MSLILNYSRILFVIVIISLSKSDGSRILGLFTSPSKSHVIIHMSIVKGLIEKGHDVTVVSTIPIPDPDPNPKYRHIQLDVPNLIRSHVKNIVNEEKTKFKIFTHVFSFVSQILESTNKSINDPKMQKLMTEEKFDLLLLGYFFNDIELGIAAHFKCPVIISWMIEPTRFHLDMVGNPIEISYVPSMSIGVKQPMRFLDRVLNFIFGALEEIMKFVLYHVMAHMYESNFPATKYPSFSEMQRNISLILVNHHFTQSPVRSLVPAIVEIGGIQIKDKPNPLPEDIQKFLDSATEHGAIFFSLGSNAFSSELKPEIIRIIYNVLSNIKQKVIWKWEADEVPGLASNILFKKWLPQDDILAHPNLKLFISHGGKGSVVESQYHGVPILGLPFFADQFKNLHQIEIAGYGMQLDYLTLNEDNLKSTINELLENPKYKNNVENFSKLYRDRPQSALETAVFWVEYVIRHHGAPHMQSPAVHMNFIQYYSLDVIAFFIFGLYLFLKISKITLKFVLSKLFNKKYNDKNKNKID